MTYYSGKLVCNWPFQLIVMTYYFDLKSQINENRMVEAFSGVIRNKIEIKVTETADSPSRRRHDVPIPSAFKAAQKVEVRRKCNRNGTQRHTMR